MSFFERLFGQRKRDRSAPSLGPNPTTEVATQPELKSQESQPRVHGVRPATKRNSLFAFVDPKDPFTAGEIAGEELPGPILSVMSARQFGSLFLFHTPHTRENALATKAEVSRRYPECSVSMYHLPVSDPKDYSSVMGHLAKIVHKLMLGLGLRIGDSYVCVSSGTAEMRAAWFLLTVLGAFPAKLLQVGSPVRPLFGEANVKEVRLDPADWAAIGELAIPNEDFRPDPREPVRQPEPKAVAVRGKGILSWLRRERRKPGDVMLREKPKSSQEIFEEAFVERMRMRYGDLETERRLPSLRKLLRSQYVIALHESGDQKLSTDKLCGLGREFFARYEQAFRRLSKAERLDARVPPWIFGDVRTEVLREEDMSAAKNQPMEDSQGQAPEVTGQLRLTRKQLETLRRAKEPLRDEAAGKRPAEPAEGAADEAAEEAQAEGGEEEFFFMGEPGAGPVPGTLTIPGLDDALSELGIYVGSAALRHAAEQAGIAAESHLPVLLLGETGTGKERFAHLIHRLSPRFHREFVPVNCAAIPTSLAESYLLGHVKGSFTGATNDGKGIFEAADQSTLFLDEIAELTLDVQAKLLRVIQDGIVQRLGSAASRKVDVRIIAASNRDLRKEVSAGRFREDLYFRLEVVQIRLPALRDRRSEIPELALMLLRQINQRRQKPRQLTTGALERLERQTWPGNVRDLLNVLERSVLYSRADVIDAEDLIITCDPPGKDPFAALPEPSEGFKVEEYLTQVRNQLFLRALEACKGNQTAAAELLGVSKQAVSKFVLGQNDKEN